MKLIVGLGNPGPEYALTPHNAGFLAIDRLAKMCSVSVTNRRGRAMTAKAMLAGEEVLLAKPETFMNSSGLAVAALLKELELDTPARDLIVLYDELAFPLGRIRIAERGSANGHNGIKSILALLGAGSIPSGDFLRIRIGVGKSAPDGRDVRAGGSDYLLAPLRRMQLQELEEGIDQAIRAVEKILKHGVQAAMNEFNRREPGEPDPAAVK